MFSKTRSALPIRLALCAVGLLSALACGPALAQNDVRVTVQPPAKAEAPKAKPPVAMKITADEDALDAPPGAGQTGNDAQGSRKSKFPNRDTAKNRQDYEMGTDSGAGAITLGADKDSGDTVAGYTPPKKTPQKDTTDIKTIEVRPIIPLGGRR